MRQRDRAHFALSAAGSVRFVTRMRWKPKPVCTGPCTSMSGASQHTLSKAGTIWPGPNSPRAPPRLPEGHVLCSAASAANALPSASASPALSASSALSFSHTSSSFTRIWLAATLRPPPPPPPMNRYASRARSTRCHGARGPSTGVLITAITFSTGPTPPVLSERSSRSKISTSSAPILPPAPRDPYASSLGMYSSQRSPARISCSASVHPLMTWDGANVVGEPRLRDESNTVPSSKRPS
mmetsp:Transcript_6006/g.17573  ORF Transcript_6006/g.17573 Transcript_6006/m.17573 type:complete len:240 (-) Transcript_6006:217-936(-)